MNFVDVTTARDYEERKDRPGLSCDKLQCDHQVKKDEIPEKAKQKSQKKEQN